MIVLIINDEDITIFNLKSYAPISIHCNRPPWSTGFLDAFKSMETISLHIHVVDRFCRIKYREL